MDYANDPVIAQFEGHPGRTYEVRQDDRGYYVTRTDATRNFQPEVNHPDSMGGNESFETESAAYFYAMGSADGDRRA